MTKHGIEGTAATVRGRWRPAVASVSLGSISLLPAVAVWLACVLAGVLAIVFGLTGGARDRGGDLARGGALLGLGAVVAGLAGAAVFALNPIWSPAVNPDPAIYGSFLQH